MQLLINYPFSPEDRAVLSALLANEPATPVSNTLRAAKKAAPKPPQESSGAKAPAEDESVPETPSEASDEFEAVLAEAIDAATKVAETAAGKARLRKVIQELGIPKVSAISDVETARAFLDAIN